MSTWFAGENDISCGIDEVKDAAFDPGGLYAGVVGLMPGMSSVELVDQGSDFVTIRTNEGLMRRTNITRHVEPERVVLDCDEEYQAGSRVTTTSHVQDEFTVTGSGVTHRAVVSDLEAPGVLGFLYRTFGRSSMQKAFLSSYKAYFETQAA